MTVRTVNKLPTICPPQLVPAWADERMLPLAQTLNPVSHHCRSLRRGKFLMPIPVPRSDALKWGTRRGPPQWA
jgi:hypothetical protein